MNNNSSVKRVIIALVVIFLLAISGLVAYFLYSRTIGENEYCRALREQKDISLDYSCSVGKEYQNDDGTTYVYLSINRPNKVIIDHAIFTMEKETKKVISEAWAD